VAISHEIASFSLAVAALGTNFTTFNNCITRAVRALSALKLMQHGEENWSGTVRHMRWRMRAISCARLAA
jgi:hypothetical protein